MEWHKEYAATVKYPSANSTVADVNGSAGNGVTLDGNAMTLVVNHAIGGLGAHFGAVDFGIENADLAFSGTSAKHLQRFASGQVISSIPFSADSSGYLADNALT